MNLDKKALAGFIKEVEDSRDRQKGETELQRGVFKRAREKHFDVKALRIVLQRRAMETTRRDEQDYNVHAYELALGAKKLAVEAMEQGATAREAARAHGLPRAAVTALKAGTENGNFEPEPDHDPATGEVIEINPEQGEDGTAKPVGQSSPPEAPETAPQNSAPLPAPDGGVGAGTHPEEGGAPNPVRDDEASADERDASASSSPPKSCGGVEGNASSADVRVEANAKRQTGVESGPQDTDPLTIPPFLRRAPATVQP